MRLEYLPQDFRNRVWRVMDWWINRGRDSYYKSIYKDNSFERQIVIEYTVSILHQPHDSMEHLPEKHRALLRKIVLDGKYHQVLSLVEFVLRSSFPQDLRENLVQAFEAVPVAYSVATLNEVPTIVPRSSMESGAATQQAIMDIENKGPEGAKTHLRNAADDINPQTVCRCRKGEHSLRRVSGEDD